jgi:asparagine synthase (glutamine-hydrolysing)
VCGILGIASARSHHLDTPDALLVRLRDLMAHRGPDGSGLWRDASVALAHTRLAVIDPTHHADQPMESADGRWVVVYNGELYNDADLRLQLTRRGAAFRTSCDTETLVEALAAWGDAAIHRLRGMYAFAALDREQHRLILARDPLGIKPLYWWRGSVSGTPLLIFASEPAPILRHPAVTPRPDLVTLSAYLTTIRTTLGERTLFEGLRTLTPGQIITFDLADQRLPTRRADWWDEHAPWVRPHDPDAAVRRAVEDSVRIHLRADVPLCALLSGGLDSTILARLALDHTPSLRTFCAGAPDGDEGDLACARLAAEALGTTHTEVHIDPRLFLDTWDQLIHRNALPLSTPNEVAIRRLAVAIREAGCVVTLSGEGADELFAGYEHAARAAADFEASPPPRDLWSLHAADFQIRSNAWVPAELKPRLLTPVARAVAEGDAALRDHYRDELERLRERFGGPGVACHLAFHRRINLAGLLLRLDQAAMLESVEARTPLADRNLCLLAESLAPDDRFRIHEHVFEGKRVLRRAFAHRLPPGVATRPKASFPLPFRQWLPLAVPWLDDNAWARDIFTAEALAAVRADPAHAWHLAWPILNIARWGRRWWG